jgi:hypothetical protein
VSEPASHSIRLIVNGIHFVRCTTSSPWSKARATIGSPGRDRSAHSDGQAEARKSCVCGSGDDPMNDGKVSARLFPSESVERLCVIVEDPPNGLRINVAFLLQIAQRGNFTRGIVVPVIGADD